MNRVAAPTSIAIHVTFLLTLFLLSFVTPDIANKIVPAHDPIRLLAPLLPRVTPNAGGGGGKNELLPVPKGDPPRTAPRALIPPATRRPDYMPQIAIEPAIELLAAATPVTMIGDPFGKPGLPSDGPGQHGGVGGGLGPGNGDKTGPGMGPGGNSGIGGNARIAGTTPPVLIFKLEPEFSEEARKARLTGVVQLVAEIDVDGQARLISVRQGLGLGLDERAVEAVKKWCFRPATRNGRPVASPAFIEVMFHLL